MGVAIAAGASSPPSIVGEVSRAKPETEWGQAGKAGRTLSTDAAPAAKRKT